MRSFNPDSASSFSQATEVSILAPKKLLERYSTTSAGGGVFIKIASLSPMYPPTFVTLKYSLTAYLGFSTNTSTDSLMTASKTLSSKGRLWASDTLNSILSSIPSLIALFFDQEIIFSEISTPTTPHPYFCLLYTSPSPRDGLL